MSHQYSRLHQDRYDPNEYGEKKKAAMRHARDVREERDYYGHDGDREYTFQPKVNKRPAYLDKGPSGGGYRDSERERARERDREYIRQKTENHHRRSNYYDERDRDYSQHVPKFSQYSADRHKEMQRVRRQIMSDDAMERPLPATLKNLKIEGASAPAASEEQQSYSVGTYTRPRYNNADRFDISPTNRHPKIQKSKLGLKMNQLQPSQHNIRHQFENFEINAADPTSNYLSTLRGSPNKKSFVGGDWNDSSVVERVDVFNSKRDTTRGKGILNSGKTSSSTKYDNRDHSSHTPPNWSETREAHIRALSNRGKGAPEPMTDEIDDEYIDDQYDHHHRYPHQQSYQGERVVGKGGMKGDANGARNRLKLLKKKIKPTPQPPRPPVLSPVKRAYGSSKNSPPKAKSPLQERQLKRKEMRAYINNIRPITPEEEENLGYKPLYQAEPIILSSPKKKSVEISPARDLMSEMDTYESPKEKKEMEEKAAKARDEELSIARKETKKVKIIRRESHGDVESEEEDQSDEEVDEIKSSNNNDEDDYDDPLDDFENVNGGQDDDGSDDDNKNDIDDDDDDDDDDNEDIMKKNKRLQNKIKKRHQKSDKDSSHSKVGEEQRFSPIHKLHDYSEPPPEDMNYVPLYVAGPILTKKQLEQLKKDKQLEKAQEQSAWRHNHDINESKRVDYEDDNHRNSGSNNNVGSSSSNSRSGMVDGNKDSKDTQDLPDMIGRDALPRTPAAGSKFVEPEEVTEFDVRRLYMEPFSPLPEPQVIGRSKDEDELKNEGPRKPDGPHHSPREVLYQPGDDPAEAPPKMSAPTLECPHCHRTFNEAPYKRHIQICQDVFGRKKTAYDSSENHHLHDATGEKLKRTKKVLHSSGSAESSSAKKDKWKKDSSELRTAMREGRKVQRAIEKGGPMPDFVPTKPDDSFVQCPHCERKFNEHAAARHIPQCKNIVAKPSTLKRGAGLGGGIAGAPVSKKALGGMR